MTVGRILYRRKELKRKFIQRGGKVAKNILLLFLSDVKVYGGKVSPANYKDIGETQTTNESAVRYLAKVKGAKPDKIFCFTSDLVKGNIKGYLENSSPITHIKFFTNRIADDINGVVDDVIETCNFYEDADIQKTMESVVEMASKIQDYVSKLPDDTEVKLHVDMTGGMRHASLMMLVITRLIQYSGVTIGNILYSNFNRNRAEQFVEEANEIYNLFDVISGAEEFVRFGSVDAIKSYFENRDVPEVLQNLLDAMSNFAEAIKISRRSEFQKALEELQAAYKKFSKDAEKFPTLNYNLMQQLKFRIGQEYAELLNNADNDIFIINWCLEHGYLQQALTLYTECLPYMIVTKDKLLTVSEDTFNALQERADNDNMKRQWEFLLLNEYSPRGCEKIKTIYDEFIANLRNAIAAIHKGIFDIDAFKAEDWIAKGIIKFDYENYIKFLEDLQKLKAGSDLKTVEDNFFSDLIPKNKSVKKILNILANSTPPDAFIKTNDKIFKFHYMIINKMLTLNIDDEDIFLKIMERYFTIKNERNNSAHALMIPKARLDVADSEISYAKILKDFMKQGLDDYAAACRQIKS